MMTAAEASKKQFKQGDQVVFTDGNGDEHVATYVRRTTPTSTSGSYFVVVLNGHSHSLFCTGTVGRSLRKA